MLTLILAAALGTPPIAGWRFVDESTHDGRSVVTYRSVELSDTPLFPLRSDEKPPEGARFGSVRLGPGSRYRLGVMWHAASGTLWFDADGDGRFAAGERVQLAGSKPHEAVVSIPMGENQKLSRTIMIRKRGDGLAWAVRGYTIGSVMLGSKRVAAMLTDGDANGCFDDVESDRIWLDLDGDGKFDPLTEQFPLGKTISIAGAPILMRPQANGLGVTAHERPKETGNLVPTVLRISKSDLMDFCATYVSEFGELVAVRNAGDPTALPIGKYRLQSVTFRLAGQDGHVWSYFFYGDGTGGDIEVVKAKDVSHPVLDGLKLIIEATPGQAAKPGDTIYARPDVIAKGVFLSKCEIGSPFGTIGGRDSAALIELSGASGPVLDVASSGFA